MIRILAVCLLSLLGGITTLVKADAGVGQADAINAFESIFKKHAAIMLLIDPQTGAIRAANRAAEDFYGYPQAGLSSMSIDEINLFDAHQVAAERMLASDQQRSFFRFRHQLADGSIVPVNVYSTPVGGEDLLLSVIHPVQVGAMYQTELEHYQQQLEQQLDDRVAELKQARFWQVGSLGLALLMLAGLLLFLLYTSRRLARSEQAYRREHGFLQTLLNAPAGFAVIAINRDGVIDFFNQEAERLLGYRTNEVVGKRTPLLFHRESDLNDWFTQHTECQDTRQARRTFWGQLAQSGAGRSYWTLIDANDRPVDVALLSTALPTEHDEAAGWLVLIEPLEKQASLEARYFNPCHISERAANLAGIGAWSLEIKTGQMRWNTACYHLLGFDKESIQASYSFFRQAVHPADRNEVERAIEQATLWQAALDCEFRVLDDHGRMRWLRAQGEPVAGDALRVDWLVGAIWDVTSERNTREQLREREELFRALYEQSPVSIMIHDPETGQCLEANQTALSSYGFSSIDQLKQADAWLDPPYSLADAQQAIRKAGVDGACEVEWTSRHVDGSIFHEWVYLHPIELNQARRVVSIGIDITSRLQAEQALQRSADQLRERVRELNCLHNLAEIAKEPVNISQLLNQAVALLPEGMEYHQHAIASIVYSGVMVGDEHTFEQKNRIETPLIQAGEAVGRAAIAYPDQLADELELRFLSEERQLLDTFSEQLIVALRQRLVALQSKAFTDWQAQTQAPMLLVGKDGRVLHANPAARQILDADFATAERALADALLQQREAIDGALQQAGFWQGLIPPFGSILVVSGPPDAKLKETWQLSVEGIQ